MATNNCINQRLPQPLFFAYPSANLLNVTGDGSKYVLAMDTVLYDLASNYNNGTYTFTASQTGNYYFTVNLKIGGITVNHVTSLLLIEPTGKTYSSSVCSPAATQNVSNELSLYNDTVVALTAGDTVTFSLTVSATDKTIDILTNGAADQLSWIAGYLLS